MPQPITPSDETPGHRIRAALAGQGITLADVARTLQISRSVVSTTVRATSATAINRRVAATIARLLGQPAELLWPALMAARLADQQRAQQRAYAAAAVARAAAAVPRRGPGRRSAV
jgi:lambda repressor-like predicted transcriptional regulator